MKRVCVTSFANSLLSSVLNKLLSFLYKIKLININILQNFSASKFKEMELYKPPRTGNCWPAGKQVYWYEFALSLSLSLSLSLCSDQAWSWPWWWVSCAHGVCVSLLSIILLIPGTWYDTTSLFKFLFHYSLNL